MMMPQTVQRFTVLTNTQSQPRTDITENNLPRYAIAARLVIILIKFAECGSLNFSEKVAADSQRTVDTKLFTGLHDRQIFL